MNGQLIVFSYFCRKYAALGKMEVSFLCSRLRYFLQKISRTRQSGSKLFLLLSMRL